MSKENKSIDPYNLQSDYNNLESNLNNSSYFNNINASLIKNALKIL